jgi:hypothetical protein
MDKYTLNYFKYFDTRALKIIVNNASKSYKPNEKLAAEMLIIEREKGIYRD